MPIDAFTRRIIGELLNGHEVEYGMLGIRPNNMSPQAFLSLQTNLPQQSAAEVDFVTQGSPAHVAGIKQGDVVVKVQGEPVRCVADLMRMVGMHPPDTEIDVTVWKRSHDRQLGRMDTFRVKLGKWPVQDDEGIIETVSRFPPWRGISVDYPTARSRYLPNPFEERGGLDQRRVLVSKVVEREGAIPAALQPGEFITHVNGKSVQTPREFHEAVKGVNGSVKLRTLDERTVIVSE